MAQPANYPNRMAASKPQNTATVGGNAMGSCNWEERKDPVKFDFADGTELVGVLLAVDKVQLRDQRTSGMKLAIRYTVKEPDTEEPCFFFGAHQIDQKLSPRDVGHYVTIRCEGEDKTVVRNGNAMKIFKVLVSKETAPGFANDGTAILDDDLPPASAY